MLFLVSLILFLPAEVIVQASPHVVSAGDTAEDFAIFAVVQEQVLVGSSV